MALDLGTTTPGHPLIWPDAVQLSISADAPWYLAIRGEAPFSDQKGHEIPIERMSWTVVESSPTSEWTPMGLQDSEVFASDLPTGVDGKRVTLGLRFDPAWSDFPGGPYHSELQFTLYGGNDLTPSYIWPQPLVAGSPANITYYAGGTAGGPAFDVRMEVLTSDGTVVAVVEDVASPATWCTLYWDGLGVTGTHIEPGSYRYEVRSQGGTLLAQGVFTLATEQSLPGQGVVRGSVRAGDGYTVGAMLLLFDSNYRLVARETTDTQGAFSFSDIPNGMYFVEAHYPGYVVWSSPRFIIDEEHLEHTLEIVLTPNNAMFISASIQVISAHASVGNNNRLYAGDVIELRAELRNTGTRVLRMPKLEVTWPEGVLPVAGPDEPGGESAVILPDLKPGESTSYHVTAVAGLRLTDRSSQQIDYIRINANAWAENGGGDLQRVQAPPRFIAVERCQGALEYGGQLALQVFLDIDGDGVHDQAEPGAVGVRLRLSNGIEVVTGTDGWVYLPVEEGLLSVQVHNPVRVEGWQTIYTADIHPGEVVVSRVGVQPGTQIPLPGVGQAVLSWAPSAEQHWQGVGEIVLKEERSWSVRWHPPTRVSGTFSPGSTGTQIANNHSWVLDTSASGKAFGWRAELEAKPNPETYPARLTIAVAAGALPRERQVEFDARSSGPYQLPDSVSYVTHIALKQGGCVTNISPELYSWSPDGSIWLAQPPEVLLATEVVGCIVIVDGGENRRTPTLHVSYIPGIFGQPLRDPMWGAVISAQPERAKDTSNQELKETFQVRWAQPWHDGNAGAWRLRWERNHPGSAFIWEGGTISDPSVDPVGALLVEEPSNMIPFLTNSSGVLPKTEESVAVWPPYIRVSQLVTREKWLFEIAHERSGSDTQQHVSAGRAIDGYIHGNTKLSLWRLDDGTNESGVQLQAATQLAIGDTGWELQVDQQAPRLQGSAKVSWRRPHGGGPSISLRMDTLTQKTSLETQAEQWAAKQTKLTTGLAASDGAVYPWTRLEWRPSALPNTSLQLAAATRQRNDSDIEASLQSGRLGMKLGMQQRNGLAIQFSELSYHAPGTLDAYSGVILRYSFRPAVNAASLLSQAAWAGPLLFAGPGWHGSGRLSLTAHRLTEPKFTVLTGSVSMSLRRTWEAVSVSAGANWPWQFSFKAVSKNDNNNAACQWFTLERRLLGWNGAGVWGGVELRRENRTWSPRLHISLH